MKTAYIYTIVQRWIFLLAVVLLIVLNFLSSSIPFGGQTVAEVSAKYPSLITPAGYAFGIWGLIYFTLAIFAVFQLDKGKNLRMFRMIFPYFLLNVISNVLWLVAFQHELIGISVLIMAVTLGSLIVIFKYFYRLKRALSTTHRYFFQVPFSLYFGWISVASIVNVAAFLNSLNIGFLNAYEATFGVIMLAVGAILALFILLRRNDYIYLGAVAWAYIAIWFGEADHPLISNTAKYAALAMVAVAIIHFVADRIKVAQYGSPHLKKKAYR